jgi:hypothetical protein
MLAYVFAWKHACACSVAYVPVRWKLGGSFRGVKLGKVEPCCPRGGGGCRARKVRQLRGGWGVVLIQKM